MQLNLSYGGDDRFMNVLRTPNFFTNIELSPVGLSEKSNAYRDMFKLMLDDSRVCSTVVPDLPNSSPEDAARLGEMAATLSDKPVINYVSGAGRSFDDVLKKINAQRVLGYRDFVAVTGQYLNETNKPDFPGKYTDAIDIIRLIQESGNDNSVGVTVNPFKYIQEDSCSQYAKLARKLNHGARFVVAQTGWDMKKYQELLWFLRSRNFIVPLIARIQVLSRQEVASLVAENATDMLKPGLQMPLYVASKLAREAELDDEQFFSTQVERAAFIAAGCELMGYSGLQVAGLNTTYELEAFLDRLDGVLGLYQSYEKWCTAWNARFDGVTFVPFSTEFSHRPPYYLYNALMNPAIRDFSQGQAKPSQLDVQPPSVADKLQSKLADPGTPEWIKKTVSHISPKPLINEDRMHVFGLENDSCPKRLVLGPCGDSKADGICPHNGEDCFFQRILRLAIWSKHLDLLEK